MNLKVACSLFNRIYMNLCCYHVGKTRTQRKSRAPPPRQVFPRGTPTAPPPSTLVERDREEERLWARLEQLEGEEEEFLKHEAGRELGESESLVKGADANPLERELLSKKGGMQQDRESSGITDATGNLKVKAPSNVSHEQGKDRDYEKKESSADELKRKVTFVGDKSRDARTSDGGSGRRDEVFTGDKPSPLRITVTHTRTEPSAVDLESCEASSSSEVCHGTLLLFVTPSLSPHGCEITAWSCCSVTLLSFD